MNEAAHQTIQSVMARTEPAKPAKNLAPVALGKLGGLKGGKARAAALMPGAPAMSMTWWQRVGSTGSPEAGVGGAGA